MSWQIILYKWIGLKSFECKVLFFLPALSCIFWASYIFAFILPSLYFETSNRFRAFCKKNTQVIFNFLIFLRINKNYSCNFYSTWICFSLFKFWFFYNTFDSATYILWVYCLKALEEVMLCLTWLSYMYTMWVNIIYFPPRHSASQIFCFIPGLVLWPFRDCLSQCPFAL